MKSIFKPCLTTLMLAGTLQVAGLAHSQTGAASAATPLLIFETSEMELGSLYINETTNGSFNFTNSGTADLVIDKIDSSCGCVAPELSQQTYKPGEKGEIRMQFDPSQVGTTGWVKKDIIAHSNDVSDPRHVLSVRAFIYTIKGGIPYEPAALQFGDVPVATSQSMTVAIYEDLSGQLSVLKAEPPGGFQCEVDAVEGKHGAKWLVKASNKPASSIGPVSGILKIHTNNKAQPVLEIPVSLNIVGHISVDPSRLFFGFVAQESEALKAIRLSSAGEPFNVLSASSDLPFIELGHEPDEASKTHTLTVSLSEAAPSGRFGGTIAIKTDNQYQPSIVVPILGIISRRDKETH